MTVARRALASGERLAWGGEARERLWHRIDGFWKEVLLREVAYPIDGGLVRREAFWRCSNDRERLKIADSVSP